MQLEKTGFNIVLRIAQGALGTLLLASQALHAQTIDDCAKVAEKTSKAPFTIACSGRSECLATDTLTVTPVAGATQSIYAMCLDFGSGWLEWLPVYKSGTLPQAALSYPLSSMYPVAMGRPVPASAPAGYRPPLEIMRTAVGAKVPVQVVIAMDSNGTGYREWLTFDLAALWSGGQLAFGPVTAECSPCFLDGSVVMKVPSLAAWRKSTNADLSKLQLVLNGTRMPGITPLYNQTENGGVITFKLQRFTDKPESMTAWGGVLQTALAATPGDLKISLADDRSELAVVEKADLLKTVPFSDRVLWGAGAFVIVAGVLIAFGIRSKWAFVRDDYGIPTSVLAVNERTFSLGKIQMTVWTVIVIVGFVLVAVAVKSFPVLNETLVALLGISVGTAVGALAVVPEAVKTAKDAYDAEPAATKEIREAALQGAAKSVGIWTDISRSGQSPTPDLHRLQNMVFTAVLIGMFIYGALYSGGFPTFPPTLLALMGVSGGAYVGFKAAS